jgi:L-iditol 2-dehydrogenase
MSAAHAAMVEPLAVAVHAVELAALEGHETCAIIGLGPIGLLTAQVLRANGIETIYGADLLQYRVDCAAEHGVTEAVNGKEKDGIAAIRELSNGRGVDVAFDCSNSAEGVNVTCRVTRPAGRCILTGISGNDMDPLPVSVCRRRELTLKWCRRFRDNYGEALSMMEYGKVDIEPLLTHSFSLEDTPKAFELVANYADGVLKASIDF